MGGDGGDLYAHLRSFAAMKLPCLVEHRVTQVSRVTVVVEIQGRDLCRRVSLDIVTV